MPSIESRLAELERIKEKQHTRILSPVELAHWFGYHLRNYDENPTDENRAIAYKIVDILRQCKPNRKEEVRVTTPTNVTVENVPNSPTNEFQPDAASGEFPILEAPVSVPKPSPNAEIIRQRIREMKRPKWTAQSA